MKKIALFILFFYFQNLFCQEYHFDGFLEYKDSNDGRSNFYFYNSNDDTYRLSVFERFGENYGGITDTKNKLIHEHEVINIDNSIKFNYQSSRKWQPTKSKQDYFYDIIEKEIDSSKTEVTILIYLSKKKEKIYSQIELIIDHSELFANKNILFSFTDGIFIDDNSRIKQGIPISIKVDFPTGFKISYTLIRREKINTILTINDIKIKQY